MIRQVSSQLAESLRLAPIPVSSDEFRFLAVNRRVDSSCRTSFLFALQAKPARSEAAGIPVRAAEPLVFSIVGHASLVCFR